MDAMLAALGATVLAFGLLWGVQYFWPRPRIVREHERGLRYRKGRLLGEVGPGRYWLRPRIDELQVVDTRRRQVVVAGQEVLTSDRVPIKVSLICEYTIADVRKALAETEDFQAALYGRIQLALREVIAERGLDDTLAERGAIGAAVREAVSESAARYGVELHEVQVRDFMMAAGLRSAYSDVVLARQQGLAALEKARGESAAVRNLANTAALMERNPGILQLRLLQAVETSSGNRFVISLDPERSRPTGDRGDADD
ncbi:MAG: slipin family protein [Acidobacteria bacterium]|nr:MAG: slipin family protein [Acidobacteriota bacterium]REK03233.1 MAG: slipin family protein [Acidobacteriota bacterium]